MNGMSWFGLVEVSAMLLFSALEPQLVVRAGVRGSLHLGISLGFLQGAWPFWGGGSTGSVLRPPRNGCQRRDAPPLDARDGRGGSDGLRAPDENEYYRLSEERPTLALS